MRLRLCHISSVAILVLWPAVLSGQQPQLCSEWQDCRQLALDAAAGGQYERFHDLAWRAVQTGPRNDPALMFLLARAQVLSGRPTDALVMLRRLAGTGVATAAITDPDFSRARELPAWPQVEKVLAAGASAAPPSAPALAPAPAPVAQPVAPPIVPPVAPAPADARARTTAPTRTPAADAARTPPDTGRTPAPDAGRTPAPEVARTPAPDVARPPAPDAARTPAPAPARTPAPVTPRRPATVSPRTPDAPAALPPPYALPLALVAATDAAQFSTPRFRPAGLAFDAVSQRFVIGDALARKLIVVGTGSAAADDLVRAESAQFDDVAALAIDVQRGDLWVASAAEGGASSALHRLQLVSGRPLRTYRVPAALGPAHVVDLAVQPSGGIVALDAAGSRLLSLARGAEDVVVALQLRLPGVTSVAANRNGTILHIAHEGGIARVDVNAKSVTALAGPKGLDLSGFAAIRMHRDSIVGLQPSPEGPLRLVRLELNATGRAVREAAVIGQQIADGDGPVALNITGDDLYYLTAVSMGRGAREAADRPASVPFVIRHMAVR